MAPRNCIYLENVWSLLGFKMEMKQVLLFIIQELGFHVSLVKGQCRIRTHGTQANPIPLRFCISWQQEISKRHLVLRWTCVNMQNVGFPAPRQNTLQLEERVKFGQAFKSFSSTSIEFFFWRQSGKQGSRLLLGSAAWRRSLQGRPHLLLEVMDSHQFPMRSFPFAGHAIETFGKFP